MDSEHESGFATEASKLGWERDEARRLAAALYRVHQAAYRFYFDLGANPDTDREMAIALRNADRELRACAFREKHFPIWERFRALASEANRDRAPNTCDDAHETEQRTLAGNRIVRALVCALSPFHASIIATLLKDSERVYVKRHGLDVAIEEYIAVAEAALGKRVHASGDLYKQFEEHLKTAANGKDE